MRGVGSQFRWGLAVVAERAVAALDRGSHTLGLGGPDELERVGGVAHQPVENAAQQLGGGQAMFS